MNREEVTQAISELIENFQNLPRDEKLTFLTFNQYHHKRSINEVVSIYVQNPEARLLGSFDYWKNLSTESSVAFGQKASVRIWNEYGRVKETLYDVSQTTLREDLHLLDTIIEERVLVNTLAELVNGEYLLGDFQQQEFNIFASQYINEYIDKTVPSLPNYTEAQKALALSIAKFNIFEEFGAFLEDDNDYQAFVQTILNDFDKLPADESLLRTFALANNFSQEFSRQILANYERVANLTEERLEKQEQLHQKLEELEPHINFQGTTPHAIETSTATSKSEVAEIEWNESSSNEIFEFINRSHEHAPINRSVLEAMIRDEIKLEELNETGYYKVETTLGRIYLGDGFESNKQLYQALSDDNELNIDVQSYYDSIAPEKVQQLSIKEVLQQVRDKMNLPESFKVKSIGSGDFAIMKETLGGILNEPIVDWNQDGGG